MKTILFKFRIYFKPLIFSVMMALVSSLAIGQKIMFRDNVYYKSNQYELSAAGKKMLVHIKDSLALDSSCTFVINGHADDQGSPDYNMKLSSKRAEEVRKFLSEKGIAASQITVNFYGETQPIAENTSREGKKKNRRAEITISTADKPVIPVITSTMNDFYGKTAQATQKFCVNPERDTLLKCAKGTLVYVKANSFNITPKQGSCVTVEIKEVFTRSEMILENIGTTANGDIVESQGVVFTSATDWNGNKVELARAKTMVVMLPSDTIKGIMRFDGERVGEYNMMNWAQADNNMLNSFTGKQLKDCWNCLQQAPPACDHCGFFFCRVKRVGKAVKGISNKEQHIANVDFRACQKKLRSWKKNTCSGSWAQCGEIYELLKRFEVNNVEDLKLAVREGNSKGKKITLEEMQYYIFNVSKMGWVNPGTYSGKNNLLSMEVNLTPTAEVDCKLVMKNTHAVHPGLRTTNNFVFGNVPKNEAAYVVAIKYANERSYFYMKEVSIDNNAAAEVTFQEMSIADIKKELSKLDMDIDMKSAKK